MPLVFKSSLDDSAFMRGLRSMGKEIGEFNTRLEGSGKKADMLFKSGIATGALAAGAAILAAGKAVLDFGGNLRDAIDSTDMNADAFQRQAHAFATAGASQEAFIKGAQTLAIRTNEARESAGQARNAFASLGISMKDIEGLSTGDVLLKISDATKGATNSAVAMAAAQELLGKSGKTMQAGLKQGSEGIKELGNSISALTDEQISRLDKLGDKIASIGKQVLTAGAGLADFMLLGGSSKMAGDIAGAGKADTYKDRLDARANYETRMDQKLASEKKQREIEAEDEWERRQEALQETHERGVVARYKQRADEFKKIDEDAKKEDADRLESKRRMWMTLLKDWENGQRQVEDALGEYRRRAAEATEKHRAKLLAEAHSQALAAMDEEKQARMDDLAEKEGRHHDAQNKLERDTGNAVRRGLMSPQDRRAEDRQAKRETKEENRLNKLADDALIGNTGARRGAKSGDARRAQQIAEDRRDVKKAKEEVALSKDSIDKLVKAIEALQAKP